MQKIISSAIALTIVLMAGLAVAGEATPEFGGYCPVAYVAMNKAVKGDPGISMDFAGKHYAFGNEEAKKMFEADPSKYQVAYDGYCATAVGMGKKLDSDPTIFTVKHGVTYLFSSADAKKMFEADAHKAVAMADKKWAEINPAYGGYCPVAYVAMNKAVPGNPEITAFRNGELILLATDQDNKMFKSSRIRLRSTVLNIFISNFSDCIPDPGIILAFFSGTMPSDTNFSRSSSFWNIVKLERWLAIFCKGS